jgi:hypothetical protein
LRGAGHGVLREAEIVGDRHIDQAVYAMLAADWHVGAQDTHGARRPRPDKRP